jgi:hypothetical protein
VSQFPYVWVFKAQLPDRKGQRCRKIIRPDDPPFPKTVTVEFEDGHQAHDVSSYAIRRAA